VCGDDVEPLETHRALLRQLGKADIIIPYFTKIGGRPWRRHALSIFYTWLVNRCSGYPIHYYNSFPIFPRTDVLRFHVETTGFGYQAEFLTRLLHERRSYVEMPLTAVDRPGSGSVNLRNTVSVAHSLLKIALRRLRVYLFK